jgi:hypothetical protein
MSLSSLQSAFSGGVCLVSMLGGGRAGAFRIHGTLRHRNKNAGRCQSLFVFRAGFTRRKANSTPRACSFMVRPHL